MSREILFIVITFVIILSVILLSQSLSNAALTVALMSNFLVISMMLYKISMRGKSAALAENDSSREATSRGATEHDIASEDIPPPASTITAEASPLTDRDMYSADYDLWKAFSMGFNSDHGVQKLAESGIIDDPNTIDGATVLQAQRRQRERQAIEGQVTKTVDYYKYYFEKELDKAERKDWWGEDDY